MASTVSLRSKKRKCDKESRLELGGRKRRRWEAEKHHEYDAGNFIDDLVHDEEVEENSEGGTTFDEQGDGRPPMMSGALQDD